MIGVSETIFKGGRSGIKKDGTTPWYNIKVYDEEKEEIYTIFVEGEIYKSILEIPKNSPISLTYSIVPATRLFKVEKIELLLEL